MTMYIVRVNGQKSDPKVVQKWSESGSKRFCGTLLVMVLCRGSYDRVIYSSEGTKKWSFGPLFKPKMVHKKALESGLFGLFGPKTHFFPYSFDGKRRDNEDI